MVNAYFVLLIFPCVGGEHWLNVGTELFTRSNLTTRSWSTADLALLQARMYFQDILPSDKEVQMNANREFVERTVENFQTTLNYVQRETKDPDVAKTLTAALSDAVGGYLKLYLLPMTKVLYYSGMMPYSSASKTSDLYKEVMKNLNTSGTKWRNPDPSIFSVIIKKCLRRTRQKPGYNCKEIKHPCNNIKFVENKENRQIAIPLPVINWEDETMFTPLRDETTFSLHSPKHTDTLNVYHQTAKCCANFMGSEYEDYFDNNFYNWIRLEVVPHLNDAKMYLTLYDVLALYNYYIEQLVYNGIPMESYSEPKIKFCSVSVNLHNMLTSKTIMVIILLVLIEVTLCCIVCIRLVRKRHKCESQMSISSNSIEQGWDSSGSDPPYPSKRAQRNIIIDSDPGNKINITVQDLYPNKAFCVIRKPAKLMNSSLVQTASNSGLSRKTGTNTLDLPPKTATNGSGIQNKTTSNNCETKLFLSKASQSTYAQSYNSTSQTSEVKVKTPKVNFIPHLNITTQTFKDKPKSWYHSSSQTLELKPKSTSSQTPAVKSKDQSSSQTPEIKPKDCSQQLSRQKKSKLNYLPPKSCLHQSIPKLPVLLNRGGCRCHKCQSMDNVSKNCGCPPSSTDCSKFCERNLQTRIMFLESGIEYGLHVANTETSSHTQAQIYHFALPLKNENANSCVNEILDSKQVLTPHDFAKTIPIRKEIGNIVKNNTFEIIAETASFRTQVIQLKQIQPYLRLKMANACTLEADFEFPYAITETLPELPTCNNYDMDNVSVDTIFIDRQSSLIHEMLTDLAVSNTIGGLVKDVCVATSRTLNPYIKIRMQPKQEPLPITFQYDDETSKMSQYINCQYPESNARKTAECPTSSHQLNEPLLELKDQNRKQNLETSWSKKIELPEKDYSEYKVEKLSKSSSSLRLEIPVATFKFPNSRIPHESSDRNLVSKIPVRADRKSRYSARKLNPRHTLRYRQNSVPPNQTVQGSKRDTENQLNTPDNISITSTSIPNSTSYTVISPYEKVSVTSSVKKEKKRSTPSSNDLKVPGRTTELISMVSHCSEVGFKPSQKSTKDSVTSEKKSKHSDMSHFTYLSNNSSELSLQPSIQTLVSPLELYQEIKSNASKTPSHSEAMPRKTSPRRESKLKPPGILPNYIRNRAPEIADNKHKLTKSKLKMPEIRTRLGNKIDIKLKIVPENSKSSEVFIKQSSATNTEPIERKTQDTSYCSTIYPSEPEPTTTKSRHKEKNRKAYTTTDTLTEIPEENTMKFSERISKSLREHSEKPRGILKYTRRPKIIEAQPKSSEERPALHVVMKHPEQVRPIDEPTEPNDPLSGQSTPVAIARRVRRSKS